jgi:Brp/Blh family beta-carotene 15,15'-monooxygenase
MTADNLRSGVTAPGTHHGAVATALLLAASAAGAAASTINEGAQIVAFAAGVAVIGTPHGGLDHRLGRALLRPRFGRAWPVVFVGAYGALSGAAVIVWLLQPLAALAGFLALSALHFGNSDAREVGRWRVPDVLARGGAPVVVPALLHPDELLTLFGWLCGQDGAARLVEMLRGPLALPWAAASVALVARALLAPAGKTASVLEFVAVAAAFAVLPPLVAFGLYFCALHAPRATAAFMRATGDDLVGVLRAAAPWSLAAVALAAVGYLAAGDRPSVAAVRTLFVWLSALTVPHMLLAELGARFGAGLAARGR